MLATPTASTLRPSPEQPIRAQDKAVATASPKGSAGRSLGARDRPGAAELHHPGLGVLNNERQTAWTHIILPCSGPRRPSLLGNSVSPYGKQGPADTLFSECP